MRSEPSRAARSRCARIGSFPPRTAPRQPGRVPAVARPRHTAEAHRRLLPPMTMEAPRWMVEQECDVGGMRRTDPRTRRRRRPELAHGRMSSSNRCSARVNSRPANGTHLVVARTDPRTSVPRSDGRGWRLPLPPGPDSAAPDQHRDTQSNPCRQAARWAEVQGLETYAKRHPRCGLDDDTVRPDGSRNEASRLLRDPRTRAPCPERPEVRQGNSKSHRSARSLRDRGA